MSDWTNHIKAVSKEKGITYKEAMMIASKTYKKKPKPKPKSK